MISFFSKRHIIINLFLFLTVSFQGFGQKTQSFLLTPSGKYVIGTTQLFLTDSSRKETLKRSYKGFRRLYVKVWYPSDNNEGKTPTKYLSEYNTKTIYEIFKSKNISIQDIDTIKHYATHSFPNLSVSNKEKNFPVIIFNGGFYFGMTDLYSNFMELLASNGYIVFSVTHPYQQPLIHFPDGDAKLLKKKAQLSYLQWVMCDNVNVEKITNRTIQEKKTKMILRRLKRFDKTTRLWTQDNQFILDYLSTLNTNASSIFFGKLNLNKIGTLGQSIGGATSGQLSLIDKRIKAGVNMDCFQFGDMVDTDLQTPFMLIESQYQEDWHIGNDYIFSHVTADFYSLYLLNTSHFITSDAPLLPILSRQQQESFYGTVDGKKTIILENKYILDFFNLYLKNISSDFLKQEITNKQIIYKVR